MKQVRVHYDLGDGRRTTQTFTVPENAATSDIENVVKNHIASVTNRTVVEAYVVDYTELNLE